MKTAIHPHETSRAQAFSLWMSSPMPMVTLVKTIDVSRLLRYSRRHRLGFNLLLCWCIGKAATRIPEFYLLPEKDKMYRYDSLTVNVIVNNTQGGPELREHLSGRPHDHRHLCHDCHRARLHCEPIHRQVLQPDGDVGEIPQ